MKITDASSLSDREQRFAMYVISKGVCALRDARRMEQRAENDEPEYYDGAKHRHLGYAYGERQTARDIAGSSLSELFGGMGADTINALEQLSEREDIHLYCRVIVDEYHRELMAQWGA